MISMVSIFQNFVTRFPPEGFVSESSDDFVPNLANTFSSPRHGQKLKDARNSSASCLKHIQFEQIVDLTKYQSSFRRRYMQWRRFYKLWRTKPDAANES